LFKNVEGTNKDFLKSENWYKRAADQGDEYALINLANLYSNGSDYSEAFSRFQKAAENGSAIAHFNLGYMYENGEGVLQNTEMAIAMYTKAASLGLVEASINLSNIYFNGKGIPENNLNSYVWGSIAKTQGGSEVAIENLDVIKKSMSKDLIAQGQLMAAKYWGSIHE
jgi:TPR repeat protein